MNYIKDYDSFTVSDCVSINEGIQDGGATVINKAFIEHGPIELSNGEFIEPKEIVNVVKKTINEYLAYNWGSFFSFVKNFTIIYIWNDPNCHTMCVDNHLNIYMDALFIYRDLKMDPKLIGAVIMHEIFHVVYNHLERGRRWLVSKQKTLNSKTAYENNLAADIEVNTSLVLKNIITRERLVDEIHGLFLKELSSNVPPMEEILEDERLMNKLRNMCPFDKHIGGGEGEEKTEVVESTPEFDDAYVEMKNKITELVNKYGPEEAIKKLREIGAVVGVSPRVSDDFVADDIFSLSFLQLKSYEDFLNEEKKPNNFSTKMDGYRAALNKAMQEIESALAGKDGVKVEGGGNGGGVVPKTNIDKSKLKPMNLPTASADGEKKKDNPEGGLPTNIPQKGKDGEDSEGEGGGNGDVDLNGEIKNNGKKNIDINVTYKGQKTGGDSIIDKSSIGKTGTFVDSSEGNPFEETIKKCYGDELAEKVIKQIEASKHYNTKENIEKKKQDLYNSLPERDSIKLIWDKAKSSEKKYMAMWKKILKSFLNKKTRNAGRDVRDDRIKWGEKRHMSIAVMSPKNLTKGQEPQDLNVYVDVSGSVYSNMELMQLIAESLVAFMKSFNYSGINIIPWASKSTGVHKVESISKKGSTNAVDEILKHISDGANECGGGTDLVGACVPEIVKTTFQYKGRQKMDDVHIIITDGLVGGDVRNIEDVIESSINKYKGASSSSVATKVVKNCIWMLYDNEDTGWDDNIKLGELVRISSKNILPE